MEEEKKMKDDDHSLPDLMKTLRSATNASVMQFGNKQMC